MHPGDSVQMVFAVTVNGAGTDGTIPTEIVNVGQIQSHETPQKPSNRVVVPLTQVLGTKFVRTTPPTALPFTGFNALQNALIALVLIGGGMVLITWPRLRRQPAFPS
jgi:alcohol dehydrogenase class IV